MFDGDRNTARRNRSSALHMHDVTARQQMGAIWINAFYTRGKMYRGNDVDRSWTGGRMLEEIGRLTELIKSAGRRNE